MKHRDVTCHLRSKDWWESSSPGFSRFRVLSSQQSTWCFCYSGKVYGANFKYILGAIYQKYYQEVSCFLLSLNKRKHSKLALRPDQSLSRVRLFATPWITARQASLSTTNSRSSPRPTSIESVMPSSHLILCSPLLLLPPISPSIRVFSNESTLRMRWPKYWNFSFNISPSNEHPGLISFRMDWLGLLAVQGIFKSLLQHHSSKTSIL